MKATIQDAKNLLSQPKMIGAIAAVIAVSALAIVCFGYVQWRRFVIPSEIVLAACIGMNLAGRLNQGGFSRVIATASRGLLIFAAFMLVAAILDTWLFGDIGYFVFAVHSLLWMWVPFQLFRLGQRLRSLPEADQKIVTENADVAIALIDRRTEKATKALDQYQATFEKFGFVPNV